MHVGNGNKKISLRHVLLLLALSADIVVSVNSHIDAL